MNYITGIVVKDILQKKLKKYEIYQRMSHQYKDYDMSDYYTKEINRIKSNLKKIQFSEFDIWFQELENKYNEIQENKYY